ncbi:MAG: (d)CMP kinase [Dehalobacterium sp.]
MPKKIIAIDGPAGAGKSTVARLVAKELNYLYIDTGAMYRALTYKAMKMGIPLTDAKLLTQLSHHTEIELINENGNINVICDGKDISQEIRDPEVSKNVSFVALVKGVREKMVEAQRQMTKNGGVVMDGRDICTVVLPQADCKIFLTASVEERARRRCKELAEKGYPVSLEEVKEDIYRRDLLDIEREVGPLIQAPDACLIDSTGLKIEDIVQKILDICWEGE